MKSTMNNIGNWVEFVNVQSKYHHTQASRHSKRAANGSYDASRQLSNHKRLAEHFDQLSEALQSGDFGSENLAPKSDCVSPSLHFIPSDLDGLPEELLKELNLSESDSLELAIYESLKKAGGMLPVDKILIQLYRDTGEIHQRNKLAAKLYRMASKGRLIASQEHRGVYILPEDGADIVQQALDLDYDDENSEDKDD